MTQTDKAALADRLNNIGMVTPALETGAPDTVRDIETITGEILEAKRVGGEAILTIGRGLIEAKNMLDYGVWVDWLEEKVEFSRSTANRLMRLAEQWSDASALTQLGATKALALLALPESEREEFLTETHRVGGEEKTVIDMTSRELEKAIKERDEARKAAEQAQADKRAADEARTSMEQSLKQANELLDRARTDMKTANDVTAELEKQLAELKAAPVEVAIATVDQEALDKARAEGEAAKAEEIAMLQEKLDKAQEAKKKAEERRKEAEASLTEAQAKLEASAKADKKAVAMADPEVAEFKAYYSQANDLGNKMHGLYIKASGREDKTAVEGMGRALLALADKIRGYVQ